nr:MAG TPA: hypothetical protein [Caudoviricetes sp.]
MLLIELIMNYCVLICSQVIVSLKKKFVAIIF